MPPEFVFVMQNSDRPEDRCQFGGHGLKIGYSDLAASARPSSIRSSRVPIGPADTYPAVGCPPPCGFSYIRAPLLVFLVLENNVLALVCFKQVAQLIEVGVGDR